MTDNYLEQLNPQQRQAVEYCEGPELVIAGAGSGKTRVLTYKIVHLLKMGLEPWRIMALTFTNKAAREMRERIEQLVGEQLASSLWMGTFHSIFSRLLRINAERLGFTHDFTIYDTNDSRSLIKLIVNDMGLDDKIYKPATLHNRISAMKNALIDSATYRRHTELIKEDRDNNRPATAEIFSAYEQRCRRANAMDFDDLLLYTNVLLRDNDDLLEKYQRSFQYILVDEYQDTNFVQHLIVHQLCKQHQGLCVVGDDAQSIYSFRGADIANILTLRKFYPELKIFKLEQNYRSTQNIIEAANSLIDKNKGQIAKHLFSRNETGARLPVIGCSSDYEEAYVVANQIVSLKARQGDSYEDFAVLYRTNAQSRVLEEALKNGGRRDSHGNMRYAVPYRIYGGLSFYQRKEIKDAICYFRLVVNPDDDEALRRIVNYPARGIGETTMKRIQQCANAGNTSLWQVVNSPEQFHLDVNRGTLRKLEAFAQLINGLIQLNQDGADAQEMASVIIERTRLKSVLIGDKTPENISRIENIDELGNAITEFVSQKTESGENDKQLSDFLAETSLLTDQDMNDPDGEKVTLMTVHAAKGLEFKNVIIVGVENDLFPSAMSQSSITEIEEERRLLYVAITRAKKNCVMTFAKSRFHNGQTKSCVPSPFLYDIDSKYLQMSQTSFASHHNHSERPTRTSTTVKFTPVTSRTVPKPAPAQPQPDGNFSIHSVQELSVGTVIVHNRFGKGTVIGIDNANDPAIQVKFDASGGTKKLLLKFAKFEIQR